MKEHTLSFCMLVSLFAILIPADQTQASIDILKPASRRKPTVVTVESSGGDMQLVEKGTLMRKAFCESGIPAYPSPERAARALSLYHRYHSFKTRNHL